jgi:hypothetical protein
MLLFMFGMWGQPASLLYYAVYLLLAGLCVVTLARALWPPWEMHRSPCCGACGQAVTDLLQGRCPECGGMYAKVGISTPSMAVRLRGSLPLALIAWTTICVTGGSYICGWLEQRAWASASAASFTSVTSGKQSESVKTDFRPATWMMDSSGGNASSAADLDFRISFAADVVTQDEKVESGSALMSLRRNGTDQPVALKIDLPGGEFVLKDASEKDIEKGAQVDEALVERWFKQAGINTGSEAVKRSMKDALKLVQYASKDYKALLTASPTMREELGALSSNGTSTSSGPVGGAVTTAMGPPGPSMRDMGLSAGLLGFLYLAGCVGITWRYRRLVQP